MSYYQRNDSTRDRGVPATEAVAALTEEDEDEEIHPGELGLQEVATTVRQVQVKAHPEI